MTATPPLRLPLALLFVTVASAAHADIPNFTFVGIEGVGDLDGQLDERLGTTNNADEHIINIDDCEVYVGGEIDVTVRIDPKPSGSWQYAVAYAPPDKTCATTDANPEAVDGQCYVPAAQRELTSTTIEFAVSLDELIGSACDADHEGDATLYIIIQNTSASEVKFQKVLFDVDLRAPDAPTLDEVTSGDARFTVSWTDDINDAEDTEYIVYYSDAAFGEGDLDAVDKKTEIDAKSVSIESGVSNEAVYFVSVTAVDQADNESPLSNQEQVTPASTTDFWESYVAAGGSDPGGCQGSTPADLGVLLLLLALVAYRLRRSHTPCSLRSPHTPCSLRSRSPPPAPPWRRRGIRSFSVQEPR